MLAANLKPREIFLARYDMNSISTNKGNKGNGQPAGTRREKNFKPCVENPNIVDPNTITKLSDNVRIKCDVVAKLYGTNPIKLLTKINTNNTYIKGK